MWAAARSAIASGYRSIGQIYAVPYGRPSWSLLRGAGSYVSNTQTHQIVNLCRNGSQRCRLAWAYSARACRTSTLEFDSGSERTLAAWLTHASRTRPSGLVAHGCVTRGNLPLGSG